MSLELSSSAFANGDSIPDRHAKEGGNESPPLTWSGAPKNTESFALVVEDPDAPNGTFRHWGIYNVPRDRTELPPDASSDPRGYNVAINDFGAKQYDGPRPPAGHGVHHYHFRLFALDTPTLSLANDASPEDILHALGTHVIEEAQLTGLYER